MQAIILGISAFFHDSAACLLIDGEVVAAAQEERFTRKKHDSAFPTEAIRYVLEAGGVSVADLTEVVFYEKPFLKFERLLETYHAFAPVGFWSFAKAIPVWVKEKLFTRSQIRKSLEAFGPLKAPVLFSSHHLSHAASAFFPSPFAKAAILTLDGVGEWETAAIGTGEGGQITLHQSLHFPHSLGLLYSAFTYYLGFRVNSGEYKLMGLAPYGDPEAKETHDFREAIFSSLLRLNENGSFFLNMRYFRFATALRMTNDGAWERLFGLKRRLPETAITASHGNLALAIQQVTEEIVLRMARHARALTGCENLVMAGGVALNCVSNLKLREAGIFDQIWIQPAAGDAGGALGAAYAVWHAKYDPQRNLIGTPDAMQGAYLGPEFSAKEIRLALRQQGAVWEEISDEAGMMARTASALAAGKVVGWFQGRMEFGPRALGNRSILGDPRNPDMQKTLNLKIKFRESFRPFAPAVLAGDAHRYFDFSGESPYMLFTAPVAEAIRHASSQTSFAGLDRLYEMRSDLPAITHLDYSARIQTVTSETNPRFYALLRAFKQETGCSVLVNTSFNVRGEPIVCTPADAYRCLVNTGMDLLVIGNFWVEKSRQPIDRQHQEASQPHWD